MSKGVEIMENRNILKILLFIVLLVGISYGQKEITAPIDLNIELKKNNVCSEKVIILNASLINTSNDEITVDTKGIGNSLSFSVIKIKSGKVTSSNRTIIYDGGKGYKPDYLVLKPTETYEKALKISLDNDFFDQKGKYRIKVSYQQFENSIYRDKNLWIGSVDSKPLYINFQPCK
jgi:hypothetical protein